MRKDDPSGSLTGQDRNVGARIGRAFERTLRALHPVRALMKKPLAFQEMGVAMALLALALFFSLASPIFPTPRNLLMVARQIAYLGIITVGMTFVFISGEIDLSVGSIYGFSMVAMALIMKRGVDPWLVLPIGLAFGTLLGAINGLLSRALRIQSIIITLGTLGAYRGLILVSANGWPVVGLPKEHAFFTVLGTGMIGGIIPVPALVWLLFSVVVGVFLARSVFGRHVYGVGSSEVAARVSGLNISRVKVQVLAISGFCSALAAALGLGFLKDAEPLAGQGYEIHVIAAVIIGGAKLGGGSGSMLGSILGIILVGILRNGLLLLGVSAYWIQFASGCLIVLAVAVDKFLYTRLRRY